MSLRLLRSWVQSSLTCRSEGLEPLRHDVQPHVGCATTLIQPTAYVQT